MPLCIARYVNRERITLECEVVTPLFLGGADQNAELRTAPFKAMLRYWWRALYGNSAANMAKTESELFGNTEKKAPFSIDVVPTNGTCAVRSGGFPNGGKYVAISKQRQFTLNIIDYLAYGIAQYDNVAKRNVYQRNHIPPGQKFRIIIDNIPGGRENEILMAVHALARFGGIGTRSHNGFGSFAILNNRPPAKFQAQGAPASFPTINSNAMLFTTDKTFPTWEAALSEVAIAYREARLKLEPRHKFNRRGFIARPITAKGEHIPPDIENGRHPKSVYLHVNKDNNTHIGQILYMPVASYKGQQHNDYLAAYADLNAYLARKLKQTPIQ